MKTIGYILNPGLLDRKIQLYSQSWSRSSTGHASVSYSLDSTVRAKKEYASQDKREEKEEGLQERSLQYVFWTIRKNPNKNILSTWRIQDEDGNTYSIEGIPEELGRGRYLKIRTQLVE